MINFIHMEDMIFIIQYYENNYVHRKEYREYCLKRFNIDLDMFNMLVSTSEHPRLPLKGNLRYINPITVNGYKYWQILKNDKNNKKIYYGNYNDLQKCIQARDMLESCNWDKDQLPKIKEKIKIFDRRKLHAINPAHIKYYNRMGGYNDDKKEKTKETIW